uniref:Uncharacterized protein n=1 Tax=Rhizophora mucronata TaxID=61149 RepID=A0A2P2KU21_RHIMU
MKKNRPTTSRLTEREREREITNCKVPLLTYSSGGQECFLQ